MAMQALCFFFFFFLFFFSFFFSFFFFFSDGLGYLGSCLVWIERTPLGEVCVPRSPRPSAGLAGFVFGCVPSEMSGEQGALLFMKLAMRACVLS